MVFTITTRSLCYFLWSTTTTKSLNMQHSTYRQLHLALRHNAATSLRGFGPLVRLVKSLATISQACMRSLCTKGNKGGRNKTTLSLQ